LFIVMMEIKNKVVIITGASSGIGKELAIQFARLECPVVLAARNALALEQGANQILACGGSALAVPADVKKKSDVDRVIQKTIEHFGRIDILINNAGVSLAQGPLMDNREEDVRTTLETNLMGTIYGVWAAVPYMEKQGGGQIVFVSSAIGKRGIPRNAVYCASKFAMNGLAESIRGELRKKNIRVITVCPPGVDTPFYLNNNKGDQRRFHLHSVEKISKMIIDACRKEKREVLLTLDSKLLHYGNVFFPSLMDWIMTKAKEV